MTHQLAAATDLQAIAARNAERQLPIVEDYFSALSALLSEASYAVNSHLRPGVSREPSALVAELVSMVCGIDSVSQLIEEMDGLFEVLGPAIALDQTVMVYRGISVDRQSAFDPLGLYQHHRTGAALSAAPYTDPGFGFAATDHEVAAGHPLAKSLRPGSDPADDVRVMACLDIHSGLCIPDPGHRSPQLVRRAIDHHWVHTAKGQIIFPRGTTWKLVATRPAYEGVDVVVRLAQQ